jgi:hypothetical protein
MALRDYFEGLSLTQIQEFVPDGREEDLHLEFKLISDSELKKDDRRSFARAVSGFANSDGGLIVWRVDARKNKDGVDCAVVPVLANSRDLWRNSTNLRALSPIRV